MNTKNPFNGVLFIDKPRGITSFDVIRRLRKKLHMKKIGHAGTLDPDASGLLIICLGQATKISSYLMGEDKTYDFEIKFGIETDTLDTSGEVVEKSSVRTEKEDLEKSIPKFLGIIEQVPPKYSAIKIKGKKLYEYARNNEAVEIPLRSVEIKKLTLQDFQFPVAKMRVECTKGTYVRSLARDLANSVGNLGVTQKIHRTQSGAFDISGACDLEEENIANFIQPIEKVLQSIQRVQLNSEAEEKDILHGRAVHVKDRINNEDVLIVSQSGQAMALAHINEKNELCPKRLLV